MKVYKFYNDPGHGWLAVKRKELIQLGILNDISGYSYQRGNTVYLEEDCDASRFLTAYLKEYGVGARTLSKYTQKTSPIRSYSSFQAQL
jgi:hypothetical protein